MGRAEELFERIETEGETALDDLIIERKAEELFLDFKRSGNGGDSQHLHPDDKKNLAKSISGFGNSEGGVLVWGVTTSKNYSIGDVAEAKRPLQNAHRFVSLIEGAVSGCTVPPHMGVRSIPICDQAGSPGFVATLIPKSNHAPHQMLPDRHYYIRAGSSFSSTPHDVLAGMFGRRPQPVLTHRVVPNKIVKLRTPEGDAVDVHCVFQIENASQVISSNIFASLFDKSFFLGNCLVYFVESGKDTWEARRNLSGDLNVMSRENIRLAPDWPLDAFSIKLRIKGEISGKFCIQGNYGCAGNVPKKFKFSCDGENIYQIFGDHIGGEGRVDLTAEIKQSLAEKIFCEYEEN